MNSIFYFLFIFLNSFRFLSYEALSFYREYLTTWIAITYSICQILETQDKVFLLVPPRIDWDALYKSTSLRVVRAMYTYCAVNKSSRTIGYCLSYRGIRKITQSFDQPYAGLMTVHLLYIAIRPARIQKNHNGDLLMII